MGRNPANAQEKGDVSDRRQQEVILDSDHPMAVQTDDSSMAFISQPVAYEPLASACGSLPSMGTPQESSVSAAYSLPPHSSPVSPPNASFTIMPPKAVPKSSSFTIMPPLALNNGFVRPPTTSPPQSLTPTTESESPPYQNSTPTIESEASLPISLLDVLPSHIVTDCIVTKLPVKFLVRFSATKKCWRDQLKTVRTVNFCFPNEANVSYEEIFGATRMLNQLKSPIVELNLDVSDHFLFYLSLKLSDWYRLIEIQFLKLRKLKLSFNQSSIPSSAYRGITRILERLDCSMEELIFRGSAVSLPDHLSDWYRLIPQRFCNLKKLTLAFNDSLYIVTTDIFSLTCLNTLTMQCCRCFGDGPIKDREILGFPLLEHLNMESCGSFQLDVFLMKCRSLRTIIIKDEINCSHIKLKAPCLSQLIVRRSFISSVEILCHAPCLTKVELDLFVNEDEEAHCSKGRDRMLGVFSMLTNVKSLCLSGGTLRYFGLGNPYDVPHLFGNLTYLYVDVSFHDRLQFKGLMNFISNASALETLEITPICNKKPCQPDINLVKESQWNFGLPFLKRMIVNTSACSQLLAEFLAFLKERAANLK